MTSPATLLNLRVADVQALNPLIRLFRLRADDGRALPGYTAGAHLRVMVDLPGGASDWRHYSLINLAAKLSATDAPTDYLIAVRIEPDGRGGSRYMHERVKTGSRLMVEAPKNDFPLHDSRDSADGTVLLAGGIGVTPLVSMAAQRRAEGAALRMHYAGRSRALMAFLPELQVLLGDALIVHADAEAGAPLNVAAVLDSCGPHDRLYVCGPKVMLDAVLAQTLARGWPHGRVHFELFTTASAESGDQAFEVVLSQSGQSFTVPADQTILDCLIEHGCDPMYDCKRGECGVCGTPVIAGEIDHRDHVLTARERAAGNVIQICISRAKGPRLVLDL